MNNNGWTMVKDALPAEGTKVLCCGAYGAFYVGEWFNHRDGARWYSPGKTDPRPIAWMIIPEQPIKQQRRKPAKK